MLRVQCGEVSERSKELAWKVSEGVKLLHGFKSHHSPPFLCRYDESPRFFAGLLLFVIITTGLAGVYDSCLNLDFARQALNKVMRFQVAGNLQTLRKTADRSLPANALKLRVFVFFACVAADATSVIVSVFPRAKSTFCSVSIFGTLRPDSMRAINRLFYSGHFSKLPLRYAFFVPCVDNRCHDGRAEMRVGRFLQA